MVWLLRLIDIIDYSAFALKRLPRRDALVQMNGLCEVRDKELKGLWVAANKLRAQFEECTIEHVDK